MKTHEMAERIFIETMARVFAGQSKGSLLHHAVLAHGAAMAYREVTRANPCAFGDGGSAVASPHGRDEEQETEQA